LHKMASYVPRVPDRNRGHLRTFQPATKDSKVSLVGSTNAARLASAWTRNCRSSFSASAFVSLVPLLRIHLPVTVRVQGAHGAWCATACSDGRDGIPPTVEGTRSGTVFPGPSPSRGPRGLGLRATRLGAQRAGPPERLPVTASLPVRT